MPTMYDTKAEIQGNNKTDLFLIFILGWAIYTAVLTLVMTFVFFIAATGLIFLIDSQGDSIVPRSQYFNIILEHLPTFLLTMPMLGFVWTTLTIANNNKAHEQYRLPNGTLPIFRVQKAFVKIHKNYVDVFEICVESLKALQRNECQFIENNVETGRLAVTVKIKNDTRGENILLHLIAVNPNETQIEVFSSSNVLVKGIDAARNIKNIYEICDYLKKEIPAEKIEAKLCRH